MLDVIIINAFPNNEQKISLLTNQVENLKKLNLPILIISGCQIPRHIIEQIDYYIINTDNERLEKDFSYKINNMGVKGPVIEWVNYGDNGLYFHTTNVNCTIVSNIKKSFELAKSLGFKTALYTEDDNIFNENSFQFIYNTLRTLNETDKKIAGDKWFLKDVPALPYDIVHTTFFFSNIETLLDIFEIPSNKVDWYKDENILKYKLYKTLEGVFYELLEPHSDIFLDVRNELKVIEEENGILRNQITRYQNENFLIDNYMTILSDESDVKRLVLYNSSRYLVDGQKGYHVKVYHDDVFVYYVDLPYSNLIHLSEPIPEHIKVIKLDVRDWGIKELLTDIELVKLNGYIGNFVARY